MTTHPKSRILLGRYQIVTTLGGSQFSQTYLAEDTHSFNLRCVVKKLQPLAPAPENWWAARPLFERFAQTQYLLGHHPQIPRLLAYFQEQQQFYLVQELIEGHDLSEELREGKPLSESAVMALLQDILEPLAFVHRQQVIHRALQPTNLIRRHKDGQMILINFSAVEELAAKKALPSPGEKTMSRAIGNSAYLPSEQITGQARFSSDIYTVGLIGIQALTGKKPQELEKDPETGELIWREQITVSPKLAFVLDKMVRADFRERYPSAQSALEALQQLNRPQASPHPLARSLILFKASASCLKVPLSTALTYLPFFG